YAGVMGQENIRSCTQSVYILQDQCSKTGTEFVQRPRFYPSSKTCLACGYMLRELPLKMTSWTCPNCGAEHDRDVNAAVNLLKVGAST
ncbi:MAG: transposase, partial [Clostridia bacterium]|nr:transposase [Clostridia bacterium]